MPGRVIAVALLSLISIALWVPDVPRVFGQRLGTPGFEIGRDGTIASVDHGSPAESSGIRPGQRIDMHATPLHARILLISANYQTLHPVQQFPVRIVGRHGAFTANVRSEVESEADVLTVLPRILFQLILLGAGIALVLLRPNKATWGFFLFTAFNPGPPINAIAWLGPAPYQIVMATLLSLTGFPLIANLAAVIFALFVLVQPPVPRWRRIAEALAYVTTAGVFAAGAWSMLSGMLYGRPIAAVDVVALAVTIAGALLAPLILYATYTSSNPEAQPRLRWVLFAFSVNAVTFAAFALTSQNFIVIATPYWLWAVTAGIDTFALAFAILYAVLKHHIIDINVAISRALVYTALSAIAISVFALVDLFFTRALSARNAALIVDIALALVLGFSFNSAHYRVDQFIDRVLFRQRHIAEEHLRTLIRSMPFTLSASQVDRLLAEEPLRSFALSGSAIFAFDGTKSFALCCACGSPPLDARDIPRDDALPVYLQGERCALRLNRHGWSVPGVAVPVFSHGDLTAIAVYGLHDNGTDLDGEEIALFESLALAAGNAYDRLEAKELRDEVARLRLGRGYGIPT